MKKFVKKHQGAITLIGLIILSVVGLSLPFISFHLGWLTIIGLVPFLFLLERIKKQTRGSQIFIIWLVGFLSISVVLHWLLQTQPERWTAFTGIWATILLVAGWVIMALSLSSGYFIFGWLWAKLNFDLNDKYIWLSLPALWVVCEYLRAIVFSVISAGPATVIGPYWSFGGLAYGAAVTPLVFAARFLGVYGMAALVVIINLVIYKIIKVRKMTRQITFMALGMALISSIGYLVYFPKSSNQLKVSAIQLGIDTNLQTPGVSYYDSINHKQDSTNSNILVAPEYSQIFEFKDGGGEDPKALLSKVLTNDGIAITSTSKEQADDHYNELIVYNKAGDVISRQLKQFLIPVGESSPYILTVPLRLFGKGSEVDQTMRVREVGRGKQPIHLTKSNGYNVASLVCSGAVAPFMYQDLVKQGAELLTNSASLSIFEKSYSYHQQTQQIARFMTVATNRPMAQSTDGSYSYIIDKDGNFLAKSSQDRFEMVSAKVTAGLHRTVYDYFGEWVLLISSFVLIGIGFAWYKNKKH